MNNRTAYAVRVLGGIQPFVAARHGDLPPGERTALQFWLLKVAKSLASLPDGFKVTTGTEATRARAEAVAVTFVADGKAINTPP